MRPELEKSVSGLRATAYNATVIEIRRCHDELMILRIKPDFEIPRFDAGQYTVLGLGYWEPRVSDCQPESDISSVWSKLVKRAYSVSCPLLDDSRRLVTVNDLGFLEFYIRLLRSSESHPPALTPRIFALKHGSRIFCGPQFHGRYTLDGISAENNVVFFATGTGEAPHNAMTAELLKRRHPGAIVSVTCCRRKEDFGYLSTHREIESRFPNYRYRTLTTREPENTDPNLPNYVGKQYLQDYVESGRFEAETELPLNPDTTHVYLCGNPSMIGLPYHTHDPKRRYPQPKGMIEILEKRGFRIDQPHDPGNIHFERYW